MKKILYFIAVGIGLFAACKKGDLVESTVYEKINPADPKYSYIKILNLTPASPALTFYMDGSKFSSALSTLGTENAGYAYNGLFPDLGYATTRPGSHTLTAKIIPTATADANLQVFSTTINPQAGKYYTIFTTGQYSATEKKIPSSVMLEDTRPALDTSKVFLRVVNLYNGSPNLDLTRDLATGTKIVTNIAYGTASNWVEIPNIGPGITPVVKTFFNVTGTTTPLIAAGFSLTFTKGRAYTVYLRGVAGSTTYPFSATIYTAFY
ncbi:DUF4397 domain-containing protein [Pedobacter petrophilus]|uniref:DUF4397 domain-containing protein n=1 Tax=Pedobacter petrophilus TaxID=1908241 RepID=A0A7K0G610_9SPHI|nr:DUF4397 domain-containing protein [Pedobacter petrophilus]MRX78649.1 DUF4397 domain-containing protein [Pedobacter petrophilus]